MKIIKEEKIENANFTNKTFVLTGSLKKLSRSKASDIIQKLGGNITSSVTSKTTFVICGENSGSKKDKALELNIKTIDENEFIAMLPEEEKLQLENSTVDNMQLGLF